MAALAKRAELAAQAAARAEMLKVVGDKPARIAVTAGEMQRFDQPVSAHVERSVRQSEIVLGGVTQQKRQTEKQQHHPDPQDGIATKQPRLRSIY